MADALPEVGSNGKRTKEFTLIATKLYIPPARPGLVARPRLMLRLNAGLNRSLTLVSAPAGYGKTTLLAAWRSTPPASELPFAWLSLDDGDNDAVRFWTYIVAALQTIQPGVGEELLYLLHTTRQTPVEVVLPSLINDLSAIARDFCLVLDDYHLIHTETIHQALAFLLEHIPPQLHLAISSRTDPPLPLSLLRGRGQLVEVREEALRFTVAEMTAFLNDEMGLNLPAEQVAALHALTEGWIAGLQMAAVSLRGQEDKAGFIAQFGGSHHHIADYLLEQVLGRQPEDVQAFLLHTAILKRLCGPLCDAVTARDGGQAMLGRLESANLFLIPLDEERCWYRYQHLFADLLRSRLQQAQPDLMQQLHRRAAAWLEQQGLAEEAIPHALGAGDFVKAAELIESVIDVVWNQRGEVATILNWLRALPNELMRARLPLRFCYADALGQAASDVGTVDRLTQDAEALLAQAATEADLDQILPFIFARVNVLGVKGDLAQAVQLAEWALSRVAEGQATGDRTVILRIGLGHAYLNNGEALAAEREYLEAGRQIDIAREANFSWAGIQRLRGSLRQAAVTLAQAFEDMRDTPPWPVSALGHTYLADICYEWDDLSGAVAHLQHAVSIFREWRVPWQLAEANWRLAQVYHAQGDAARAADAAQQALNAAREANDPGLICVSPVSLRALQAQFWLVQGRLDAASQWATTSGLSLDDEPSYRRLGDHLTFARLALLHGESTKALPLLARLRQQAEAQGRIGHMIQIMALQAVALQAQGHVEEAITALAQALELAEPEGYIRTFVDEGKPMATLLHNAADQGMAPQYIARLLAAFPQAAEHTLPFPHSLVEPLRPREIEVLRLIAAGLSNQEIADELVVGVSTVKKHINNLYGKLGIHSRTQAIARARELQLI